jgi:hypothetical protein
MGQKTFWIAAGCILAVIGLRPVFSSGAPPASKEKVIYSFTGGADGEWPLSDLTIDSAGNLYGTTVRGGTGCSPDGGCGTVFELERTSQGWKHQVLYRFAGYPNDGFSPLAGLIVDNAGNIYGSTASGGTNDDGTVFMLVPNSQGSRTEKVIYTFDCTSGDAGCEPKGDLVSDAHGNLYGTTSGGGGGACYYFGCGAVFELMPQADGTWAETTLHAFAGAPNDGTYPTAGVVLDSTGAVYGTTIYGGSGSCRTGGTEDVYGCGTVYKIAPSGGAWTETVLYSFVKGYGFGMFSSGELFFHNHDHVLGVTQAGGDGLGSVFELRDTKRRGWQQSGAHIFYGSPDGQLPAGRLVADASGNLFGVASAGGTGTGGDGIVFELQRLKGGWKERILHSFTGPPDGEYPPAGLVSDSQGHLYGTTEFGGTGMGCNQGSCGTVYEVIP